MCAMEKRRSSVNLCGVFNPAAMSLIGASREAARQAEGKLAGRLWTAPLSIGGRGNIDVLSGQLKSCAKSRTKGTPVWA